MRESVRPIGVVVNGWRLIESRPAANKVGFGLANCQAWATDHCPLNSADRYLQVRATFHTDNGDCCLVLKRVLVWLSK